MSNPNYKLNTLIQKLLAGEPVTFFSCELDHEALDRKLRARFAPKFEIQGLKL